MLTPADQVMDLIFGRWRSQTLSAGAEMGVFDHLDKTKSEDSRDSGRRVGGRSNPALSPASGAGRHRSASRGCITWVRAHGCRRICCGTAHPQSLNPMARLEEGPQHYALWKHLPAMVRDGKQNAFVREFGRMAFDYALENPDYAERFKQAMTSYSAVQSSLVLEALRDYDFSRIHTFCDVAGGYGHLMCALLQAHPHMAGIVFDLPEVVEDVDQLWASKLGLQARCRHVGGDMFESVPSADAYSLKMILHDWNDGECIEILSNIRKAATGAGARLHRRTRRARTQCAAFL